MRTLQIALLALTLGLGLAATGCGGGGGGGAPPAAPPAGNALLNGDFFLLAFAAVDDVTDEGQSNWGLARADGVGALTGLFNGNAGGLVLGLQDIGGPLYTVAANRATTLDTGGSSFDGWTHASGTTTLLGSATAGENPQIVALFKHGTGLSNASLAGTYKIGMFLISTGGDASSYWGEFTFDGVALATGSLTVNDEGAVSGPGPFTAAYSVSSTGQMELDFGGGSAVSGLVSASGDLVVATGFTQNGVQPALFMAIRQPTGASVATMSGAYQLIGVERDGTGFSSLTGDITTDGAGAGMTTFAKNSDGVLGSSGPDPATYTVAGDGTLIIPAGGNTLEGAITGDGEYAMVAGSTTAAGPPGIYLLMRR